MNLKTLSDQELDLSLQFFVKKENEVLAEILLHIVEVDRRRLYLKMAFPNLFTYLTKHLAYSEGSAQRRIDAARLSREVPSVIASLECGELNLSQVAFLQKTLRAVAKRPALNSSSETAIVENSGESIGAHKPSLELKTKILSEIKGKSLLDTQHLVAKSLNVELKQSPQILHQANESVHLGITLSKNQWKKLQHMRELVSTSLPHGSWEAVLEYVADKVIQHKIKTHCRKPATKTLSKTGKGPSEPKTNSPFKNETMGNADFVAKKPSLGVLKRQVLKRDKCCQYKDPKSGRVCGSRWNLQVDHIQPKWDYGANSIYNLRVLCANHNQELYRQQAGYRKL